MEIAKYETGWFLLHRLVKGTVRVARDPPLDVAESRRGRRVVKEPHALIGDWRCGNSIPDQQGRGVFEGTGRLRLQNIRSAMRKRLDVPE